MTASNEKFIKLLTRLLEKTNDDQVHWQKKNSTFAVWITEDSVVRVVLYTEHSGPDIVSVSLTVKGEEAIEIMAEEGRLQGNELYTFLRQFYTAIYNSYHKVDRTLNELEKMLDGDEPIGQEPPSRPQDIPF